MRLSVRATVAIGGLVLLAAPLHAQGYKVRLDAWYQSAAYRGWQQDSILSSSAEQNPDGSWETPDGVAARCLSGATYCTYYVAGPELRGKPFTSTVNANVWGFGISGLRAQMRARLGTDFSDPVAQGPGDTTMAVWPTSEPTLQLIEGFLEYEKRSYTVQAGRLNVFSRLGWAGFDGAKAQVRPLRGKLKVGAWGGWGLARATVLPVTSEYLNPLGEYRPGVRPMVLGADLAWTLPGFEGRLIYQVDVDTDVEKRVDERGAVEGSVRPGSGFTIQGGLEYNFGTGEFGTNDIQIKWTDRRLVNLIVGQRTYRPHFPLWQVWSVFSPYGYSTRYGSIALYPIRGLRVWTRGDAYSYCGDCEGDEPTWSDIDDKGWRWSFGGTYSGIRSFTVNLNYRAQSGPGASVAGWDGRVTYQYKQLGSLSLHGGRMLRPLEYRYGESKVWSYGLRADFTILPGLRLMAEAVRYDEDRERPDASAFSWNYTRLNLGASWTFASGADQQSLHPAILRIPEARRSR